MDCFKLLHDVIIVREPQKSKRFTVGREKNNPFAVKIKLSDFATSHLIVLESGRYAPENRHKWFSKSAPRVELDMTWTF